MNQGQRQSTTWLQTYRYTHRLFSKCCPWVWRRVKREPWNFNDVHSHHARFHLSIRISLTFKLCQFRYRTDWRPSPFPHPFPKVIRRSMTHWKMGCCRVAMDISNKCEILDVSSFFTPCFRDNTCWTTYCTFSFWHVNFHTSEECVNKSYSTNWKNNGLFPHPICNITG